ncbi:MAG: TIGR00269 family protein [Candidatus Altiarchaeales archaeon]|nr:TIGR00269 family protein [Candidatus Altiarchaeales archaeon]
MNCMRCGKKHEITLNYNNERLCGLCFTALFEKRVKKTVRVNKLLSEKKRFCVAASGGKDSQTTLYILNQILGANKKMSLTALSVDEGTGEYRSESISCVKRLCEKLGVCHEVVSFQDEFGLTLTQFMDKTKTAAGACTVCGVLRRRVVNNWAKKNKMDCVATGHNLDDEVQTALMNITRGDSMRIARLGAEVGVKKRRGLIPRIKPLRDSPEEEVLFYAQKKDIPHRGGGCPYSQEAYRNTVKEAVNMFEAKYPGTRFQIQSSMDTLIPILRRNTPKKKLGECDLCGEPAASNICKVCELMKSV